MNSEEAPQSGLNLSDAIGKLMAHPEILQMAASALGQDPSAIQTNAAPPQKEAEVQPESPMDAAPASAPIPAEGITLPGGVTLTPKIMEALPDLLHLARPLLPKSSGDGKGGRRSFRHDDRRNALLLALKPYLSPARCDTVDKLIQFGKISALLQNLQ